MNEGIAGGWMADGGWRFGGFGDAEVLVISVGSHRLPEIRVPVRQHKRGCAFR